MHSSVDLVSWAVNDQGAFPNRLGTQRNLPTLPLTAPHSHEKLIRRRSRGGRNSRTIFRDVNYNTVRLHSAIGFVTPADMLAGRQKEILDARDRKLEEARRQRQLRRQQAA